MAGEKNGATWTSEQYDSTLETFQLSVNLTNNIGRVQSCVAYINSTTFAVIGGDTSDGAGSQDKLSEVSFLNTDSFEWTTVASMKERRQSPACGVIEGIVVTGSARFPTTQEDAETRFCLC